MGRLDRVSEGALILTNDGAFANAMMHPSKHVAKTYRVTVRPEISAEKVDILSTGIMLDGRNEDEVFAAFHSDHRRKIRIALKNNVEIKIHGSEMAETFYQIMKETCERDDFELRSAAYFAKILDVFGDKARLYMAYYEGRPIAGAISVLWGDKVWYFYGASSNSDRKVMPNYLLQWEMIKWAIEEGCKIYDFRGVAGIIDESNPLFGLYRFKHRFDGTYIEFMGEMDLITKPAAAKIVAASQEIMKKLR